MKYRIQNLSTVCYVTYRILVKRFDMKKKRTAITMKRLNGEVTNNLFVISGIKIAGSRNSFEDWLELQDAYTKNTYQ